MTKANLYNHRRIGVRCYDNGGRSADRYTVLYTGRYTHLTGGSYWYMAMSENPTHPQGIGMHGESRSYIDNRSWGQRGGYSHLGKKITFDELPEECQRVVMRDVFDMAIDWPEATYCRKTVLAEFMHGYLTTGLWSETDQSTDSGGFPLDDNYTVADIDKSCVASVTEECQDFILANIRELQAYVHSLGDSCDYTAWGRAGHDFWLTRNGHGCGFWDRGLGSLGDKLTKAAKVYGSADIYVGDDGKLYMSGHEAKLRRKAA